MNTKKIVKRVKKIRGPGTAITVEAEKDLNISKRKEVEAGLENVRKELAVIKKSADEASEFAENVIDTVREPLIALDQNLRVVKVSRSFYEFFKVKPEDTVGQLIYDLGNKQWDISKLRELLETILPQKTTFDNYEVEHDFATIGRRVMLLNARQIQRGSGKERIILLAIEDITERQRAESQRAAALKALQKSYDELDCRVQERTAELAKANEMLQADIVERMRSEEMIRNSLLEKEILLKEVHHRVKNNLMTIIGLIKMEGTKAHNEMFDALLLDLEGRIHSMALVHESLHKSEDLARIDLQNYIETMSAYIRTQFGAKRNILFKMPVAGVEVGMDIAVPCGLILNELIVNAYKHAFPGGKPRSGAGNCEIAVNVMHEGGIFTMTVADNGVGLPADMNLENPETLGLRLIKMLCHQINGSLELDRSAGTTIRLKFMVTIH